MGRAKLEVELIPKMGPRILAFKRKKESLKKKLDQLRILSGVDACMVIYGPDQEHRAPDIYPNDDLHRTFQIIDDYRSKKDDPKKCKQFGLPDFWEERVKKAEEELAKLREQNMKAKYPIPREMIDAEKDPFVLREFANRLLDKSRDVKSRIEDLKRINQFPSSDEFDWQSFTDLLTDDNGCGGDCVNLIDQNRDYPFVMENDEGSQYLLPL